MTGSTAPYAAFTPQEMQRRCRGAQDLMRSRGIDVLFVSGEENFQYFTGTSASIGLHHSLTRPQLFILPAEGDPIVITQMPDAIALSCHVRDVRRYGGLLKFPHDVVLQALKEAGLRNNRVGAELGQEQRMGMPVGAYLDLVKALPRTEFVDAADIIIRMRMAKSAEELVYIRQAADITGRARQRLYDTEIKPGITERQAVRAFRRLMMEEGADRMAFCHIQNGLPGQSNQFHYDRPLERGQVIGMDSGAYVGMYTVDYPRFAVLGKASDEQRRVHEAVKHVKNRMADALRPGITASELHHIALEAIKEVDCEPDTGHKNPGTRMGHGQGILLTEPPSVTEDDHTPLEVGTVISTEPGISGGAARGNVEYLWEDVHVVTADGHEQLTLETEELREIPF